MALTDYLTRNPGFNPLAEENFAEVYTINFIVEFLSFLGNQNGPTRDKIIGRNSQPEISTTRERFNDRRFTSNGQTINRSLTQRREQSGKKETRNDFTEQNTQIQLDEKKTTTVKKYKRVFRLG